MKINISEPDISTITNRIENGIIDLQPDFQRGDVWGEPKRKKLIDSILRGWQIPPIHVIRIDDMLQEVLDGQQRLRAIYSFLKNEFPISAKFEPIDESLIRLDGLRFTQLPPDIKRKIEFYSLRVLEIFDYKPGETGELFNRLNQSLNLTAAEKRNAQVGKVRADIKELAKFMEQLDLDSKFIGFSNTRLAHDDLFARLCLYLEKGGIYAKVSDDELYERYRIDKWFDCSIYNAIKVSLTILSKIKEISLSHSVNLHITKATFFSWILFISELHLNGNFNENNLIASFFDFEVNRYKYKNNIEFESEWNKNGISLNEIFPLFALYNERASSRVMVTSSLLIRDWCISLFYKINNHEYCSLGLSRDKAVDSIMQKLISDPQNIKALTENLAESGGIDD